MNAGTKDGFTLMELILVLAIIGVTGIMTTLFFWPHLDTYQKLSEWTDARYLCDALFQKLEPELRFGNHYVVSDNGCLIYVVMDEQGPETESIGLTAYGNAEAAFIPEEYVIEVTYQADKKGTIVSLTMRVFKNDTDLDPEPLYEQTATIHSFYKQPDS